MYMVSFAMSVKLVGRLLVSKPLTLGYSRSSSRVIPRVTRQRQVTLNGCLSFCRPCSQSTAAAAADEVPESQVDQVTNSTLIPPTPLTYYRTTITNPSEQNLANIGQFYPVPIEEANRIFCIGGIPKDLVKEMESYQEVALMVRKPALEVISYLKAANYDLPAIRYVIYGRRGTGKTLSLAHIMHYCAVNNWFIIHLPQPIELVWRRYKWQEKVVNLRDPMMMDYPTQGAKLLNAIKKTNRKLIEQYQLVTSKEYVWSKREVTESGTPLLDMIEFGIHRSKYSCDVVGAVLREIRIQAAQKRYRTLVAIDAVNCLFGNVHMKVKRPDMSRVKINEVTLVRQYRRQLANDWCGGAVVVSVQNKQVLMPKRRYTPRYLLRKAGFDLLDPFVGVETEEYTEEEIESQLDYLIDRAWITTPQVHSSEGREELKHLSGYNPKDLQVLLRSL